MSAKEQLNAFIQRTDKVAVAELDSFFDSLPAVAESTMIGEWKGGVFNTGHPGEMQLGALKWAGKTFRDRNDVDPIVCNSDNGRVASDVMGRAALRSVEYRGVVTATMVYDKHPIFDHFRQVDENTLLGAMDRKGDPVPLYFYLERI